MFACLYSLSSPVAALITIAEDFTPRFEVVGPLVMLDASGLSRLFGSARDIADHLRRASSGPVRIALAPTQTAAALLALARPGVVVIEPGEQAAALASLAVSVLGEFERIRTTGATVSGPAAITSNRVRPSAKGVLSPPHVGEMWDVLPYFQSSLGRTSDAAAAPHRAVRAAAGSPGTRSAPGAPAAPGYDGVAAVAVGSSPMPVGGGWSHPRDSHAAANARPARRTGKTPHERSVETMLETLRRWGVKTFGQLAALPPGEVYERLGARGVLWQRLARGEDSTPLVPWVPEDPFESALDLEWPIEGLEPLSFVLGRLVEPLSERLERADRGAVILHTHLRLVDESVHARTLQLPAPMRDPKTLRTLVLLDLETHPPSMAIDHVRVLIEPTPARVTQWALFERAQPSPEQVSTLLARLAALMGESHVGSPRLVDSWKPGEFEMTAFTCASRERADVDRETSAGPAPSVFAAGVGSADKPGTALRRFRLPVPARVNVHEGRPTRVITDRRGVTGGAVVQAAGPWRTSGEWWNDAPPGRCWDRDEWDVALSDGTVYRIYVERDIGQWFLEGVVD